jgi:glycosyltransferase involved in cell wall biosynthesis
VGHDQVTGDAHARQPVVPSPIRVVHVVTSLAAGGLERVVLDLVRCRTTAAFDARVICLDASGVVGEEFLPLGVPVETIGTAGSVPARIVRLARRLRRLRPHIVHTHNPQAQLHGAWAARLSGGPVVVYTRHGRGRPEGRAVAALGRLATAWTTCCVAVSEDAARVARDIERVPDRKLRVIHNGIDVDRHTPPAKRPPDSAARAVTVGRLDPVKDQATLLRASRLVVDQMPGYRLDVVGDGPSRPELEALRETLGLADHVRFHGYRADVGPYLAAAGLFVLSSVSEGVPLALLEAMASGLPAVATDVGGIREVVVPDTTGSLVAPGSPEALADAMVTLQTQPGALDRMGRAARRRVEEQFNLRGVVAQYEGLYFECLNRRVPESES